MEAKQMFKFPTRNEIENLRNKYPAGTLVELIRMDDPQAPPKGSYGVVEHVDDAGQLHVSWKYGGSLALVPGVDEFKIIQRYKVNKVHDKVYDRNVLVLVDTLGTGFPLVNQLESDTEIWIYELAEYLNKNILLDW